MINKTPKLSAPPLHQHKASVEALPPEKARQIRWEYILVPFALLVFGYILLQSLWVYINSQTMLPTTTINLPLEHEPEKRERAGPLPLSFPTETGNQAENNVEPLLPVLPVTNQNLNQAISKIVDEANVRELPPSEIALGAIQEEKEQRGKDQGGRSEIEKSERTASEPGKQLPSSSLSTPLSTPAQALAPKPEKAVASKQKTPATLRPKSQKVSNSKSAEAKPKPEKRVKKTSQRAKPVKKVVPVKKRTAKPATRTKENDFQVLEQSLGL